jgi:hypothetical protein
MRDGCVMKRVEFEGVLCKTMSLRASQNTTRYSALAMVISHTVDESS